MAILLPMLTSDMTSTYLDMYTGSYATNFVVNSRLCPSRALRPSQNRVLGLYLHEQIMNLENETVFRVRYARLYLEAHFYSRCQGVGLAGL